jgi:pimeloyl-ACP methyl ester carboxylesterase
MHAAPPKAIEEKIPGSRLAIMPNSGHMAFVDQPRLFEQVVDEFPQEKP